MNETWDEVGWCLVLAGLVVGFESVVNYLLQYCQNHILSRGPSELMMLQLDNSDRTHGNSRYCRRTYIAPPLLCSQACGLAIVRVLFRLMLECYTHMALNQLTDDLF